MCLIFSKCALWPSNHVSLICTKRRCFQRFVQIQLFKRMLNSLQREEKRLVTLFLLVKWLGFLQIHWDILFWEGIYPWHCAYMHLQAPEQQTAKNSAFILTVGTTLLLLILLITMETLTFTWFFYIDSCENFFSYDCSS